MGPRGAAVPTVRHDLFGSPAPAGGVDGDEGRREPRRRLNGPQ